MEANFYSDRKTARLAGFCFIFLCIPLAIWNLSYVPSKIFVPQDPIATANNLLANEFIFRTAIVGHLASTVIFIFMVMLLYRLLKRVNKHLSRLMVAFVLAQMPIVLVLEVFNFAALMILKSEVRPTFDAVQQQEASYFLLRMHRFGIGAAQLFFGLCFIPLGMLVFRSRFVPRIFGILFIVSGIGYIVDCCTYILLPRADFLMVRPFVRYTFVGYLLGMLWFLVMGVRQQRAVVTG